MKTFDSPFVRELRKQAKEKGIPFQVDFELTGRCNFNCKMCYVHVLDDAAAKQSELTTDKWESIFDEAIEAGMMYALLTGGECLLRPDFRELYLYLYNRGVKVRVNTNALLLNEEYITFFQKHPPENIQVTLYGSCNEVYEAVTERRVFDQVRDNLFRLRDSGLEYRVVCTPNRFSFDDYPTLLDFIFENKLNIDFSSDSVLYNVREADSRAPYDLTPDECVSIGLINHRKFGKKLYSSRYIPEPGGICSQPSIFGSPCRAGRSAAAVTWKGILQPCLVFDEIRYSLLDVAFGEAWDKLKADCERIVQPVECVGCAYEKVCKLCPMVRFDGLYSGHCNMQLCELTVNMAKAGMIRLPSNS